MSTIKPSPTLDRYTWDDDGAIDELVLSGAWVHLERLDAKNYMLIVENEHAHFHLNVRRVKPFEVLMDGEPHVGEWNAKAPEPVVPWPGDSEE